MDFLLDIPILGVILQFLVYLFQVVTTGHIAPIILGLATPIALGALCGVMNERSGVVNIGIEGMMLFSAYIAFMVALYANQAFPSEPSPVFGATPALISGLIAAIAAGVLISLLHAWLSISVRADQIISGTIINITALGLTSYLNRLIKPFDSAGTFKSFQPPEGLTNLPGIGWLFEMFTAVGPIAMSVIALVVFLQIMLFRSRWGLRTRAVGEHPKAADTVGINVIRLRYRNVLLGGVFAGLAGAYLTLEATGSFQNGMTAGRGFIALAALIFGRWTPLGSFGGALLFMGSQAIGVAIRLAPPAGDLGAYFAGIQQAYPSMYNNFFNGLPYLLTIIVLAGVVGRSAPPAADGQPYEKESST
ncbi:MAG: ABC transporter permease [Anaerolineales bacterium]|nr:ABC transporter permease [Anaerolineales bacterium]